MKRKKSFFVFSFQTVSHCNNQLGDYLRKSKKQIFLNNICLTSILQKPYNRFHKPGRTPAYLFQIFYSKVPNQSRPPVPELIGYIYSYSAQRTTSNQLPIRLLILSFGSKACKLYLEDRDSCGNTFRSVRQMAQHTNYCHDIAIIENSLHFCRYLPFVSRYNKMRCLSVSRCLN